MRLKLLILFLLLPVLGCAQTISLELKNEPLPIAFKKLEQVSGYKILFTYDDVQAYHITASVCQTTVSQAIQTLISGKPLTYTLKDNKYIIITPLSAQTVFSMKGTICDSIGNPLENATLILRQDGKVKTGGISDKDGNYTIRNLHSGQYTFSASFMGYETVTRTLSVSSDIDLPPIVLKNGDIEMNEIIIKGGSAPFRMKHGNIIANIARSTLSKETDILEMLRKLPGMTLSYGELVTFTGGKPQIYINGKKASSMDEVKQLEIKNIKQVELIPHSGAEYDSSVDGVMLITTFNRQEGWAIQIDGNWQVNHRFSNEEGIKANYRHKKLNLSGTFTYEDGRRRSHQIMETTITVADTLWQHATNMRSETKETACHYSAGIEYDLSKTQNIGMQYSGSRSTLVNRSPMPAQIYANQQNYDNLLSRSYIRTPEQRHYLNAYYTIDPTDKLSFKMYADYAHIHSTGEQNIYETSQREENKEILISAFDDYRLYAVGPQLIYRPHTAHTFTGGNAWSLIDGRNSLTYTSRTGNNSDTRNKEQKYTAYLSYAYRKRGFSFNVGLRYEHVLSEFRDLLNEEQNSYQKSNDLFPSVGVSYNHHHLSHSLSYRAGTYRPSFALLNKNVYYMNRFCYQEGNPRLKSQFYHRIRYALTWKEYLYANLSYTYNKNYIGSYFYAPVETPSVEYYTWINYDRQQQIAALINLHYRFSAYEPSLTLSYMQNIQKVSTINGMRTVDKPRFTINMENNFHLPHHWLATVEYEYATGYSSNIFTFREKHILHVGLTKSFLRENLLLKIRGYNLLRKRMNLYDGSVNNIDFRQDERQDERNVSFSIVYRFNNYSKKYKGKNAADDVLDRL